MKEFKEKGAKCFTIFRLSDSLNLGRVYALDEDAAKFSAEWFFEKLFKIKIIKETAKIKKKRIDEAVFRPSSF